MDDETRWKMGQHRGKKRTEEVEGKKTGTAMIGSEVGALTSQCLATERGTRHKAIEAMGQSVGSEQGR